MTKPDMIIDDIDAIAHAERELAAAHLNLDLDTIDELLHPEYVILQPDGKIETKAQVLESYRSTDRHWSVAQVDQLEIRILKNTAIVFGRWRAVGQNDKEKFDYSARFLSVWIKDEGRWQNLAYKAE